MQDTQLTLGRISGTEKANILLNFLTVRRRDPECDSGPSRPSCATSCPGQSMGRQTVSSSCACHHRLTTEPRRPSLQVPFLCTVWPSQLYICSEFGERLSQLPSNPMPSQIKDFDSLLSSVRKFLEENSSIESVPLEKMNKYQLFKLATVESKQKELEFLESLNNDNEKTKSCSSWLTNILIPPSTLNHFFA